MWGQSQRAACPVLFSASFPLQEAAHDTRWVQRGCWSVSFQGLGVHLGADSLRAEMRRMLVAADRRADTRKMLQDATQQVWPTAKCLSIDSQTERSLIPHPRCDLQGHPSVSSRLSSSLPTHDFLSLFCWVCNHFVSVYIYAKYIFII